MLSPRKQPDLFANPRAARAALADEIERLMDALDALDGDPDLEDEPDDEDGADEEPSLGWTDAEARRGRYGHRADPMTGAAYAIDAEEDEADREVGMNELFPAQSQDVSTAFRGACFDDDEDGHDAEYDTSDDEAPLGWAESESLTGELRAGTYFGEDEDDDEDADIADQPHDEEPDAEPAQCHIWGGAE